MAIKVIALRKSARRPRRKRLAPLAYTAPLAVNARVRVAALVAPVGVLPMTVHAMTAGRGKPGPGGVVAIVGQGASALRVVAGAMFKAVLAGLPRIAVAAKLISTAGQVAQISATALAAVRAKVLPAGVLTSLTGRATGSLRWLPVPFVYTAFIAIVGTMVLGLRMRAATGAVVSPSAVARLKVSVLGTPQGKVSLVGNSTFSGAAKTGAQVLGALAGAVQIAQRVVAGVSTSVGLVVRFLGAVQASALLGRAPLALRAFATQMFSGRAGAKGAAAMAGSNMLTLTVGVAPKGRVAIAGQARAASSARPGSVAIAMLASRAMAAVRAKIGSSTALALTVRLLAAVVGNGVPSGKVPLTGEAAASVRGRSGPSGIVPVLGRTALSLFGKAAPSLASSLVGRAFVAAAASLQNAVLPLALSGRSDIALRARDFLGGAVGLAGRTATTARSKVQPALAAMLQAAALAALRLRSTAAGAVGLAGRVLAVVQGALPPATLRLFFTGTVRIAIRARTGIAATTGLSSVASVSLRASQIATTFVFGRAGRFLEASRVIIRSLAFWNEAPPQPVQPPSTPPAPSGQQDAQPMGMP